MNSKKVDKILFIVFISFTLFFLVTKIDLELKSQVFTGLDKVFIQEKSSFDILKAETRVGWFNLIEDSDYQEGGDQSFVCFQYILAPTLLSNIAYEKKIICYYNSPELLELFCKRNKKYKIIRKDILKKYALLEKKS